jgi:hypothetical protein
MVKYRCPFSPRSTLCRRNAMQTLRTAPHVSVDGRYTELLSKVSLSGTLQWHFSWRVITNSRRRVIRVLLKVKCSCGHLVLCCDGVGVGGNVFRHGRYHNACYIWTYVQMLPSACTGLFNCAIFFVRYWSYVTAGLHKFSENLEAISKSQPSERWHEANPILSTHRY